MFTNLYAFSGTGLLLLRIGIATSFLYHGLQKRAMWKMQPSQELPMPMLRTLRRLSIIEPIGAVLLLLGLFAQPVVFIFGVIMVGAMFVKTTQMEKKFGEPGGWELDVVLLPGCLSLLFTGGGMIALDTLFF